MTRAASGALLASAGFFLARKYLLHHLSPEQLRRYERQNFHGKTVNLSGGIKVAAGCVTSALALSGNSAAKFGAIVPVVAGATLGYIDDSQEQTPLDTRPANADSQAVTIKNAGANPGQKTGVNTVAKGFHGHLRALAQGKVTTGALKIAGIGIGAGIGAIGIGRSRGSGLPSWVLDTVLIAGSANLANLFDLRPGRCLKLGTLISLVLSGNKGDAKMLGRGALTVCLLELPKDLGEKEMLGDTGANALGALLGVAVAQKTKLAGKLIAVLAVVTLNAVSEKISFSQVISGNAVLRTIDNLGRRC